MSEEIILDAYKDPEKGLTGNIKLLKSRFPILSKYSNTKIQNVLKEYSETYQRNKRIQRNKFFRSYYAGYVGQLIHMDLMTLNVSKNKQKIILEDYKYLLVCVDTYSRMLFVFPCQTKQKNEVENGVNSIINYIKKEFYNNAKVQYTILTDSGGEFNFKNNENVIFKKSKNKYGAVLSEYWIYKLRNKIRLYDNSEVKHLTLQVLNSIVENSNNTIASSISDKFTPNEIFYELKHPEKKMKIYKDEVIEKFKVGSFVRIINYQEKEGKIFAKKSAYNNWSKKVFSVLYFEQDSIQNIYQYKLISLDSKHVLDMLFYEHELLEININYVNRMSNEQFIENNHFSHEEKKLYKIRLSNKKDFK